MLLQRLKPVGLAVVGGGAYPSPLPFQAQREELESSLPLSLLTCLLSLLFRHSRILSRRAREAPERHDTKGKLFEKILDFWYVIGLI